MQVPADADHARRRNRPSIWEKRQADLREHVAKVFGKPSWRRSCKSDEAFLLSQQSKFSKNDYVLALLALELAERRAACGCADRACAVDALMADERRVDGKQCNIMSTAFEAVFKREGPSRWISVHGPEGLCGNVLTQILEYDAKVGEWTFVQKRVVTREGPRCSGDSTIKLYSHSAYTGTHAKMDCEYIDMIIPRPLEPSVAKAISAAVSPPRAQETRSHRSRNRALISAPSSPSYDLV